jgi:hypothetical protein
MSSSIPISSGDKSLAPDSFIKKKLSNLEHTEILDKIKAMIETYPDVALECVEHLAKTVSQKRLSQLSDAINKQMEQTKK